MHSLQVILVAGAALALPLGAQRAPGAASDATIRARDSIQVGGPVRLRVRRAPGSPFVHHGPAVRIGTFAGWRGDTLLVRFRPRGAPTAVPPRVLRSLDRSTGRCPSVGGAIAGSVVGLASGVAMAALVATLDGGECGEGPCGAATLVLGASTGMLLGTLMGYERGSVRWMPVRLR